MPVRIAKPAVNIREKLAELERPIGVNGSALMRTETPHEAFSLIGAGRKNIIINGDFSVSQRATYTSSTSISHNVYYLDRWVSDVSGVTATFRQITTDLPKQYRNLSNTGLRFEATSSSSSAYLGFRQKYEFMSGLDGKYVTVSAWVKSNKRAVIINYDGSGSNFKYAQHSGNGGWEYLSYTTYISSTSYNFFDIWLINPITYSYTPINSGDYVEVTNYQVEIGKIATPFEYRSYAEELALCQRYFQVIMNGQYKDAWITTVRSAGGTTTLSTPIKFSVAMRVSPNIPAPTVTNLRVNGRYGDTALTGGTTAITDINERGFGLFVLNPTASGWTFNLGESLYINAETTTSNILTANAEL